MKKYFDRVLKLYKDHTQSKKGIYRKRGIRPGTDWKVIAVTFFVLLAIATGVNLFLYIQIKNNAWWTVDETNTVYRVKINQKALKDTVEEFGARKEKFEEFASTTVSVGDPSL
jgi:hypothetical protein